MIIQMNIEHSLNRPYHGSFKQSQQLKKKKRTHTKLEGEIQTLTIRQGSLAFFLFLR